MRAMPTLPWWLRPLRRGFLISMGLHAMALVVCFLGAYFAPSIPGVVCLLIVPVLTGAAIRNEWTYRHLRAYIQAVYDYQLARIDAGELPEARLWESIPDYSAIMRRFWEWDFRRFCPPGVVVHADGAVSIGTPTIH